MVYQGPERRAVSRPASTERGDVAVRLLLTTERLERLAARLEAYVEAPDTSKRKKR